ncbi:MAG: flagellar basal body P-ring formation chaperone FlgA [bacterium]
MKSLQLYGIVLLCLLIVQTEPAPTQTISNWDVSIRLYDIVYVAGGRVILGEIAALTGDPEKISKIQHLQIGPVMKLKEVRIVTVEELKRTLPPDIRAFFIGAPAVEVHPRNAPLEHCDLYPALTRRLDQIAGDSLIVRATMSATENSLQIVEPAPLYIELSGLDHLLCGGRVLVVDYRSGTGEISRFHKEAQVAVFGRLTFPTRTIKRGEKIRSEDLTVKTVDLGAMNKRGFVFSAEQIVGWETARFLQPEDPISWDQVCSPTLVHRGDAVDLLWETNQIRVKTRATALETGLMGETIWVRLDDTGKRLRAKVNSAGCVIMD